MPQIGGNPLLSENKIIPRLSGWFDRVFNCFQPLTALQRHAFRASFTAPDLKLVDRSNTSRDICEESYFTLATSSSEISRIANGEMRSLLVHPVVHVGK